jgi:hypothetical protein
MPAILTRTLAQLRRIAPAMISRPRLCHVALSRLVLYDIAGPADVAGIQKVRAYPAYLASPNQRSQHHAQNRWSQLVRCIRPQLDEWSSDFAATSDCPAQLVDGSSKQDFLRDDLAYSVYDHTLEIIGMSLLSVAIMFLSFAAGLFAIRELKILAEGDVEPYQVVRAISLITMTITPYFIPDPWNNVVVIAGLSGLVVSFFLKPKDYL